ncbi:MAG: hypothetical protein K5641_03950 [Lachnospiraceae bacterium]|nr:hypothetical protein [Lachnospiraceae bacterium]
MEASVIRYSLDLLVRLVDTTTGGSVDSRDALFFENGQQIKPMPKGGGNYIFLNEKREDRTLTIRVYGYEECELLIRYDELDSALPTKEAFLIPAGEARTGESILRLTGTLKGITAIEAVCISQTGWCISEFDERKRIMKLFRSQNRFSTENIYYGLINTVNDTYESFEILKQVSEDSVKIKKPLEEEFSVNSPISRIVFGRTYPDGRYVLAVRDNATDLRYLVKYRIGDVDHFQAVDFHQSLDNLLK